MSVRELKRVEVLARVKAGALKVKDAAVLLGVCERQAKRLWATYRRKGPTALRHRSAGRRSNRATPAVVRRRVLQWYRKKYAGDPARGLAPFGPTLAAEHLREEDGVAVDPETLRRWLIAAGLWRRQRKGAVHRQRRERRAHFGELVQIDGSFEAWLEDRGPRACLLEAIDDATGIVWGHFSAQETTWAAAELLRSWVHRYGIPVALYTDWKNVYLREPTEAERVAGTAPRTQFGRMCDRLGIAIIGATSPQAKGRVERTHGTAQDRLEKKLRRKGITEYDAANAFLDAAYFPGHNARFARPPRDPEDYHTPVPRGIDLTRVFRLETERVLSNDWVVRHENRWFQLERQSRQAPARSIVRVCEDEHGGITVEYRGRVQRHRELPEPPAVPVPVATPRVMGGRPPRKPATAHPWRLGYGGMRDGSTRFHSGEAGYGNASGVDAPRTHAHPAAGISRQARDSRISTSP